MSFDRSGTFCEEMTMTANLPTSIDTENELGKLDAEACPSHATNALQMTDGTFSSGNARPGPAIIYVCDRRLIQDIRKLREMRSLQRDEAVPQPPEIAELWLLLRLRYDRSGRVPYDSEWAAVDRLSLALSSGMNESLTRRWASSQVPMLVTYLPLLMLLVAATSLCSAIHGAANMQSQFFQCLTSIIHFFLSPSPPQATGTAQAIGTDSDRLVVCYLLWSVSMGAIGAAASVGMNAISVLNDVTFDISSKQQNHLRMVLGGVFALVLALPFGLADFTSFCGYAGSLVGGTPASTASLATSSLAQAFALVMPFLLGFSTSLVTNVLSRFINGLQMFFTKSLPAAPEAGSGKPARSGQPAVVAAQA
jgi:hypothetical protein